DFPKQISENERLPSRGKKIEIVFHSIRTKIPLRERTPRRSNIASRGNISRKRKVLSAKLLAANMRIGDSEERSDNHIIQIKNSTLPGLPISKPKHPAFIADTKKETLRIYPTLGPDNCR